MCGITGFIGDGSRETLERMTSTLIHRGPDDEGYFFQSGRVGLGFRRLAIIDLETGNQPVFNEDRSIAVLLNGEIYNFKSLRAELEKRHTFRTSGDTEVIPHLYEEVRERVFEKLNGMFAIAIWDGRAGKLILARDRFGKKPLYYALLGSALVFASEPKAILTYPGMRRELDFDACAAYLTHEYVPSPRSIYRGISKLEPGSFLVWENGRMRRESYYHITFGDGGAPMREEEGIGELDRLLTDAVEARLVSDVPLGVFLSGGLDSSTVAYYAQRSAGERVKTFSIGFTDPAFDESAHARAVAAHLGTDHHEEILDADQFRDLIPEIFSKLDEPLADPAIIPNFLLSRFSRKTVTVALGGDGGDEIFMGYPTFQAHRLANALEKLPAAIREGIIEPVVNRLPVSLGHWSFDYRLKRFLAGLGFPPGHRDLVWIGAFRPDELSVLLTPDAYAQVRDAGFTLEDRYLADVQNRPLLERSAYLYQKTYLPDDILALKDRASMFVSLELRAPLLDYRVVDFANHLPIRMKLRRFTSKYLLKKLMAPRLPPETVWRKKKGFGVPVARWLSGSGRELVLDTLSPGSLRDTGLFNVAAVERLIREHFEKRADHRKQLWALLVFMWWREQWHRPGNGAWAAVGSIERG
ncbi:MAG: asparagine synthase (glutamine-hydrolyzing) [Patescibacteria group bacterium]